MKLLEIYMEAQSTTMLTFLSDAQLKEKSGE